MPLALTLFSASGLVLALALVALRIVTPDFGASVRLCIGLLALVSLNPVWRSTPSSVCFYLLSQPSRPCSVGCSSWRSRCSHCSGSAGWAASNGNSGGRR